jgi:hypothetical protein
MPCQTAKCTLLPPLNSYSSSGGIHKLGRQRAESDIAAGCSQCLVRQLSDPPSRTLTQFSDGIPERERKWDDRFANMAAIVDCGLQCWRSESGSIRPGPFYSDPDSDVGNRIRTWTSETGSGS